MLPYASWLVWLVPIVSSLLIPLISRLSGKARNYFAVLVMLVTLALAFSMIPDVYFGALANPESNIAWIPALGVNAGVLIDSLSVMFASLVAFLGLVIIVYSLGYMSGEESLSRYYFFMLLFIGSMIGLVMSDNFLQMFIFWEMVGLCSFSLISFWYKRSESVRAGIKVFIMTRIGDVCLLGAIALLYINLGSFSFAYTIAHIATVPLSSLTIVAFLILGAAVAKSAQFPLNTWLYSAMEAPTSVSALLHGATMVKAGVFLIARIFTLFGPVLLLIPMWLPSVTWVGAITALIGATLALRTTDIKGVAAYSTISQIGLMMAALGAATSASSLGWFAGLFHLTSHAFFQGLDFLLIGGIVHALGTRDMRLMGGLRKAMPVTFGLAVIVLLTRAGFPPFASFFSKEFVMSSLWSTGNALLVLVIYATTAITFAYSLRAFILTFMRDKSENTKEAHVHEAPRIMLFSAGILAVLCVGFGLFGSSIAQFMHVNVESGLSELFSSATLVFLFVLFLGGLPVYINYYKKSKLLESAKKALNPLSTVLENGYYLDAFYEKVIVGGIFQICRGLGFIERTFLERLPYVVASGIVTLAHGTVKYFDVLVDGILNVTSNRTMSSSETKKTQADSLEHLVAAALLGLLILMILIVATILG